MTGSRNGFVVEDDDPSESNSNEDFDLHKYNQDLVKSIFDIFVRSHPELILKDDSAKTLEERRRENIIFLLPVLSSIDRMNFDEAVGEVFFIFSEFLNLISYQSPKSVNEYENEFWLSLNIYSEILSSLNSIEGNLFAESFERFTIQMLKVLIKNNVLKLTDKLYRSMLVILQKMWNLHNHKKSESSELENLIEQIITTSSESENKKRIFLFKLIFENVRDPSSLIDKFLNSLNFSDNQSNLTYLTIIVQYAKVGKEQKLTFLIKAPIFSLIKNNLSSSIIGQREESLFLLKYFTSNLLKKQEIVQYREIRNSLIDLSDSDFETLWDTFFELMEILDEKQLHIVTPYLSKLSIFEKDEFNEALDWFLLILSKMLNHENRSVVKTSLQLLFKLSTSKESVMRYFQNEVVLYLNKNISWVFDEDFYSFSKLFANFFANYFNANSSTSEKNRITKECGRELDILLKNIEGLNLYFITNGLKEFFSTFYFDWKEGTSPIANFMNSLTSCIAKRNPMERFCQREFENDIGKIYSEVLKSSPQYLDDEDLIIIVKELSRFYGSIHKETLAMLFNVLKFEFIFSFQQHQSLILLLDQMTSVEYLGFFRFKLSHMSSQCSWITEYHFKKWKELLIEALKNSDPIPQKIYRMLEGIEEFVEVFNIHSFYERSYNSFNLCANPTREYLIEIYNYLYDDLFLSFPLSKELFFLLNKSFGVCKRIKEIIGTSLLEEVKLKRIENSKPNLFLFIQLHLLTDQKKDENQLSFDDFLQLCPLNDERSNWEFEVPVESEMINRLESEFHQLKLQLLINFLKSNATDLTLNVLEKSSEFVLDQMDKTGPKGILTSLKAFIVIANLLEGFEPNEHILNTIKNFAKISWMQIYELRKCEFFKEGIKLFSKLIVQNSLKETCIFMKYADKILIEGDSVPQLPFILMESMMRVRVNAKRLHFYNFCIKASTFGPACPKEHQLALQLWDICNKDQRYDFDNDRFNENFTFTAAAKTRFWSILKLKEITKGDSTDFIAQELIVKIEQDMKSNKRYFSNSLEHRKRQRIAQTLLCFQPQYSPNMKSLLTFKLMDSLTKDSPQPSVRYFLEWIIIRNLIDEPELHSDFFKSSKRRWEERVGFGVNFSTICRHVSVNLEKSVKESFAQKALFHLLQLLFGQNYTVRLYAQASFKIIYENIYQTQCETVKEFKAAYDALLDVTTTGRFSLNVLSDFYVNCFDPLKHFKLEVIFVLLPKLAGMKIDEFISGSGMDFDQIYLFDRDVSLEYSPTSEEIKDLYLSYTKSWHYKTVSGDGREMGELESINTNVKKQLAGVEGKSGSLQKKIQPWKFLPIVEEIEEFSSSLQSRKRVDVDEGLIVVASLIDRIPNLGGLCRTCEIFGVSKYVVSSLRIVEDQQFKNLSVSAQKWVEILEIPSSDLETFLSQYERKGYRIFGIEQTAESTKLNNVKFPKKSLLLLGNEKFGIPTNLLHLVEECLEIPQRGLIRSLNVHVSGALCIWEYAVQHKFNPM